MDFSNTLIRCSSLSKIMAEAKDGKSITPTQLARLKELEDRLVTGKGITDKMALEMADLASKRDNPEEPELSLTTKSELIDVYLFEKFGLRSLNKDKMIMYTEKGKLVEEDAITLLSIQDKIVYEKNGERLNNEYITGEPDIFIGENIRNATKIIDIKSSWDAESFMSKILSPLDKTYWWQMQGYMALTGATTAQVCYCLVDTPETLINDEKRRLLWAMGVATDEDPIYKMLADSIEHNMKFSFMEPRLRVMRFNVERDDEAIQRVYQRVLKCRDWLKKLNEQHESMS